MFYKVTIVHRVKNYSEELIVKCDEKDNLIDLVTESIQNFYASNKMKGYKGNPEDIVSVRKYLESLRIQPYAPIENWGSIGKCILPKSQIDKHFNITSIYQYETPPQIHSSSSKRDVIDLTIDNGCQGCRENQPNQQAHMYLGGCLYTAD